MARGPGVKAGSVSHVPVAGYDFLSTFFDLAGGAGSLGDEIDGVSFLPVLHDPAMEAVQRPNNSLIFHRPGRYLESAIREGEYKLFIKWTPEGNIESRELYQVHRNPIEYGNDLADDNPSKVAVMEKRLLDYLVTVNAEKPVSKDIKRKRRKK